MAHRAVISLSSSPCCVQFLTPVALHVSCLLEIEKHFRHALCSWPGNTAQAELTAWAVRTFLSEIQRSNSETINAWREFSCGIVVFLMFSNVPFSEWGHACGQLASGCFGWLSNCDLGEWCRSCSPPCRAPLPPEPAAGALQPMARQAAESVWPPEMSCECADPVTLPGPAQGRCSTCGGSLASSSLCCWTITPAYISGTVLCGGGRSSECSKNVLCACVCKIFSSVVSLLVFW